MVLYALNWIVYVTSFWMLALSFGLDGTFLQVGPSFAAAYVLGYLAFFAPAGMGVREVALGALLRPVMGEAAWGLAIVARLWMTVGELIPTLLLARGHFVKREGEEGSG